MTSLCLAPFRVAVILSARPAQRDSEGAAGCEGACERDQILRRCGFSEAVAAPQDDIGQEVRSARPPTGRPKHRGVMTAVPRRLVGGLWLAVALGSACLAAQAQGTVARKVEPWWLSSAPEARAARRLQDLHPAEWAPQEAERRILHIAPTMGDFQGYGKLRILDLFATAALVHLVDDPARLKQSLYAVYEVLEPVNLLLRSNSGSGFWSFDNLSAACTTSLYSGEDWDVREPGVYHLSVPFTTWKSYRGAPLTKGIHRLASHGFFQMYDPQANKWVEACNSEQGKYPPLGIAGSRAILRSTSFTVADLTDYRIEIGRVASDWQRGGHVGVELTVTDAQGQVFDLPGGEVEATVSSASGSHEASRLVLEPIVVFERKGLDARCKFVATYPQEFFDPERIEVRASVWVRAADGLLREERLTKTVTKGELPPTTRASFENRDRRQDVRDNTGKLTESRAITVHENYVKWWETPAKARQTVAAAKQMGMNILHVYVYQHGLSYAPSKLMGTVWGDTAPQEDTLAVLIAAAKAAGISVQPMVCTVSGAMGEDPKNWAAPQMLKLHPDWGLVDRQCKQRNIADMHSAEFRAAYIAYLADLAKRYDIDGVSLDYIRCAEQCVCERCQAQYKAHTGGDLVADAAKAPYPLRYVEWQEGAVAELVRGVREALNAVRPGLKLSTWGHDAPADRMSSIQGRRPDVWLNNGWIDWFAIGTYGADPEQAISYWREIARMVKRPECVWPMFATYTGARYRSAANADESVPYTLTVTGDKIHGGVFARRPQMLVPMYEAFRDICKCNGCGIFDLSYVTDETARDSGKVLFPEPAVPWYPPVGPAR